MIYKGRFNQIEQGEISNENLALLANNLLKKDCVNFDIDNVGKGFPAGLSESILKYIPKDKNTSILIINGITLELYNILKSKGYTNITLAFGSWNKEKQNYIDNDKDTFEIMREYIQNNFEDNISVIKLEEIFDMSKKFDLIISNPPYAIGNEITKSIIDNVEFDQFVNLMPISDYKKKDLYKNICKVCEGVEWEGDAMVHPFICLLSKNKDKDKSWDNIQISSYDDRYKKYYQQNINRQHYAIDTCVVNTSLPKRLPAVNLDFYITERTPVDGVHYQDSNSYDVHWNILKDVTFNDIPHYGKMYKGTWIQFNTTNECNNFCNFWYKNGKAGLMHKLIKGAQSQGGQLKILLPKVDWTHPWTDEEILRDYGYTEEEIRGILDEA